MPKFYVHPVTTKSAYVDDSPTRLEELALSPKPDTIGKFNDMIAAFVWCDTRNLLVIAKEVAYQSLFAPTA